MGSWRQVKELREKGQTEDALDLVTKLRKQDLNDQNLKWLHEWVYYDFIKREVQIIAECLRDKKAIQPQRIDNLYRTLRNFADLKPEIPGMAMSNVLHQVGRVGRHAEWFLRFLVWCGPTLFRPEDYSPLQYEGEWKRSWALVVAHEAQAWIKARPNARAEEIEFTASFVQSVYKQSTDAARDRVLLEWDLVRLWQRAGRRRDAAELVGKVVRQKRTDSWAWAGAAGLHRDEQPDLALACYCQALRLGDKPEMLVRVHRELAELLAEMGDAGQASRELVIVLDTYQRNGWRLKPEISDLLEEDWYDPSRPALEPGQFYAQHAEDALILCFDEVRQIPATYLGMTESRDDRKPRPRFAVTLDDRPVSLLGRRGPRLLKGLEPGSPVTLLIGIEAQRKDILDVLPRPDGSQWDCTVCKEGVVVWSNNQDGYFKVYCTRDDEIRAPISMWFGATAPLPGAGVRLQGATNPLRERFEVAHAELIPLPTMASAGEFTGRLRCTSSGFGFINDVFVPQELIDETIQEDTEYHVIAVQSYDKKKDRYGWRAVSIRPC